MNEEKKITTPDKVLEEKNDKSEEGGGETVKKCENCEESENKYKRALADYQNLLKQTANEKQEFIKFANEQLIQEILPIYDNLKASLVHADEDIAKNGWLEGIKHVVNQFKSALDGAGVLEINTVGEKFDYNTMEAMSEEETDDEKKDGVVSRELMSGYEMRGRVMRAARVVVYKLISSE